LISFDEAAALLDGIMEELPGDFINNLNGGVYLLPESKKHPESRKNRPLYTLGEYISRHDLGKYINIYYGSFMKVYAHVSPGEMRQALKRVLIHEFTHHFEYLAGERGLEIKDAIDMERYRRGG
jgi:hypothetical protein